ncbi:unnamed protein product [Closterium sp. NIES-64]|nr:unnamed protein product [Closterium sp. NIES-64]
MRGQGGIDMAGRGVEEERGRGVEEEEGESGVRGRSNWMEETGKSRGQMEARGVSCLYVKRSIRQFEEISYDGTVIVRVKGQFEEISYDGTVIVHVYGDVIPGAVVRAAGGVIVLGRLAGKVHAGGDDPFPPLPISLPSLSPTPLPFHTPPFLLSPPFPSSSPGDVSPGAVVRAAGNVIVLGRLAGKVHPGAVVRAAGDVIVLGRLAGKVHAGSGGNRRSVVVALCMEPSVVAIATEVVQGAQGKAAGHPEVASIDSTGHICIEPAGPNRQVQVNGKGRADPVMAHLASTHLMDVSWNVEPPPAATAAAGKKLSRTAVASLVTGAYICVAGAMALAFPTFTFGLFFGRDVLTPGWIRVLGTLAVVGSVFMCFCSVYVLSLSVAYGGCCY